MFILLIEWWQLLLCQLDGVTCRPAIRQSDVVLLDSLDGISFQAYDCCAEAAKV
jgi:hypothetical protein